MKCLICSSEETEWLETVMEDYEEGYEVYACKTCRGQFHIGIKIVELGYTGINNVYPLEKERDR